jgi:signal transduction histidine kinase
MVRSADAPLVSEALRRAQVRAVGTIFLRQRPVVVALGVIVNGSLMLASGAPRGQRTLVLWSMGALLAVFVAEAWLLGRRQVTEAWLLATLVLTTVVLAGATAATGGASSPMVPLLFAPIGVGFAAFGRGRLALFWLALGSAAVAAPLAFGPTHAFPVVAAPYAGFMTVTSALVALVLLRIGVAGLTDAHARAAESLDRLRVGALTEAAARAREADATGARVAHELKNPLSSVRGLMQLLSRKATGSQDEKRFAVALDELTRMERVLSDYLDFARPLRPATFERIRLDELLEDIARLVEPKAATQRVEVALELQPAWAMADAGHLRDAVLNLVENALFAMSSGGRLGLSVHRTDGHALIRVDDDGVGMSTEQLDSVGTPFVSHREHGSGLGLAMARGVAREHGGELVLESTAGKGTTATLSLATVERAS